MSLEQGIAADRMRRWVSTMILLGALERMSDDEHRFLLKSGVAMELRLQLQARATKLHAVTERFPDRENDRFRDLIDLLLLRELEPDLGRVAEACREIFAERAKHPWPPRLTVEPSWPEEYRALAIDQAFAIEDVDRAIELVEALVDELAAI